MQVAVTGSTGLIGTALCAALRVGGARVIRLVRSPGGGADEVVWDPAAGTLDAERLRGVDAVVHLAGEPIGSRRWSDEQKRRIRDSRVASTRLLVETLAGMREGPRVLVCSSAVGFYGDRGPQLLTEDSPPGADFLARVCVAWEAAADPAREAGLRVVHLRTGVVLDPAGGALAKMLPLYRLGLGGRMGDGRQYLSWLTRDEAVGIITHALGSDELAGPVNAVAPNPVTNAEFTAVLGRVLGRPAVMTVPRFGPRLLLGEMAEALLFASQRVLPQRLTADGYGFRAPLLEPALRDLLGRPPV
jgi:hypothetical protein